ncbi:hypothetical protein [Shewanella woodyi]|uniref:hypothetical protein n=1 Tax=Shewanella woodyi TaxID=60961 RepID=UPI003747EFE8
MVKSLFVGSSILFSSLCFGDCTAPESLEGMSFINLVDPLYSKQNPNAGTMVKVSYTAKTYLTEFLNRDIGPFKGTYKYKVLDVDNGVGLYMGDEQQPDSKPTHTVLFKCLTNKSGLAIFTQNSGENELVARQNTLTYTIEP